METQEQEQEEQEQEQEEQEQEEEEEEEEEGRQCHLTSGRRSAIISRKVGLCLAW